MSRFDEEYGSPVHSGMMVAGIAFAGIIIAAILIVVLVFTRLAINETVRPAELRGIDARIERSEQFNRAYFSLKSVKASIQTQQERLRKMEELHGTNKQAWPLDAKEEYAQMVETQFQLEITYNSACGAYKAEWNNEFKNVAAPRDLPNDCALITP